MDSLTHLGFAQTLTEQLAVPRALAIAGLFPEIDRTPTPLHLIYAHNVFSLKRLTAIGLKTLFGHPLESGFRHRRYEHERFLEEKPRYEGYLQGMTTDAVVPSNEANIAAAKVCYLGALYLETFNHPLQVFAPKSPFVSGQFQLWSELGPFRHTFYVENKVAALREALFAKPFLGEPRSFSAEAIAYAMCLRLCDLSDGKIPDALAKEALVQMGFSMPESSLCEDVYERLCDFEVAAARLHAKLLGAAPALIAPQTPRDERNFIEVS